ncbi:uncharacterized protein RCC_07588 [Ramularia collo-cygni]|uniref:Decapping enzyme Dcp1 n=1 Tax=Ramularia collo-cygni TaxID=112498 RepID=A0A2D3VKT9_9PEZI|nr:uncharacterized protein RCC_07588 [Ramularia collo-cygni]CZT21723.1 uncharacterized protein RCC_07588 [Ramularia collo-cygni]
MPPKRNSSRPTHLQPQAAQSDYDTDTANNTDNQPTALVSPPPVRSNEELNLLVVRRWCPDITGIIAIAPFAGLYTCSPETQQWEKSETQGTLFICQLIGKPFPRYRVIILNRKGPENFHLDLISTENIEITEEYVIVQIQGEDDTPLIYGLWIYSDGDTSPDTRTVISKTIMECAMRAEQDAQNAELSGMMGEHDTSYGTSQTIETNESSYATNGRYAQTRLPAEPTVHRQQLAGQQIDLATLFAKPQMQPAAQTQQPLLPHHLANLPANAPPDSEAYRQSTQFVTPAEFDTSIRVPPPAQAAPQQNSLLDLFKNAKRG